MITPQPPHPSNVADEPVLTPSEASATDRRPAHTEIVYAAFVLAAGVLLLATAV